MKPKSEQHVVRSFVVVVICNIYIKFTHVLAHAYALLDAKSARLFDGHDELVIELLAARVGGQVEAIEAGVSARQRVQGAPSLDAESARTVGAAEGGEALVGYARRAGDELEEFELLLVVEAVDGLPEPLDDRVIGMIARAVVGVLLPVGDVDLDRAAEDELELARVEHLHVLGVDDLVEALDERLGLLLHAALHAPLDHALHILVLVLLGDRQVAAVLLEIALDDLAALVLGDAEREVEHIGDVVLLDPRERLAELRIERLQVAQRPVGVAQQRLVEGSREERVEQILVDERHAEHSARELEPVEHVLLKCAHRRYLHRVHVL